MVLNVIQTNTSELMQTCLSCSCWRRLARLLQRAQDFGPKTMNISLELTTLSRRSQCVTESTLDSLAAHFVLSRGPRLILNRVQISPSGPSAAESLGHLSNLSSMELIDGIGSDFPVPGIIGIPPLTKLTLSRSRDAFRVLDWREWPHLRFLELHEPFRLPTSDHDPISLCLDWIQAPQLEILSLREVPCSSSLLSDYSALDHLLDRSKQLKIIRLEICDSCSDIDKNRSKFNTLDARLNERSVDLELNLYFVHLRGLDVLSERHFKILYENRNYNIKKLTIDLDGCSDPWVGAAVQQPRACSLPGVKELHYVGVGKRRIAALQWCMVAFNCPNLEILSLLLHQQDDPFTALHKFSGFISLLPAKCHWQIGPFEIDEEYIAAVEFVAREFHRCGVTLEWYWNEYLSYCPLEL